MSKNIVVIGKSGQVAWELSQLKSENNFVFMGRNDIDLSSAEAISTRLSELKCDAIINASAYTAVDQAESDESSARYLNFQAVKNLVEYCKARQVHFTHISTDYVFGGENGKPYQVDEPYDPQSVYGSSKMLGEKVILDTYPHNSAIVRTSWVYSVHGNNFVKTMIRLMREKDSLSVICDQIGSPTSAASLARYCETLSQNELSGISHYSDRGVCSWYDFAIAVGKIAENYGLIDKQIPILPVTSEAFPTPAKRPHYSVLDKDYTVDSNYMSLSEHWSFCLEKVIKQLKEQAA